MTHSNKKFNFHFLFSTFFGLGKTTKYFSILSASIIAIPVTYLLFFISTKLLSTTNFHAPIYHLSLVIVIIALLTILAIHSSGAYAKQINIKDPTEVIIDEILGQTLCMTLTIPLTFPLMIFSNLSQRFQVSNLSILITALILNIVLFRIFDSLKPWPINRIEKLREGFGIILDDIAAGFFAAIIYYAILLLIIYTGTI